jgi:RND family efflux transporter MFP subunit
MSHSESNQSSKIKAPASPEGSMNAPTSSNRWMMIPLGVVVLLLVFGIVEGIHSRVQAQSELHRNAVATSIPTVVVVHPISGSKTGQIDLPGNTQAFADTPIYARTSGYVKKWYVDIGAHVNQGQLLAIIETPEIDRQLEQARAELQNAEANLQISEITAKRWQNLLKTNSVSQQETDQAVSDLGSKKALVASNQSNVDRLTQLQSFERIVAPFDGVITARNTDIGSLIQAGDNTTPKEIFHLASVQKLRIYISVPETQAADVKSGQKVDVTVDALPKDTFEGTIVRNSNAIDFNSRTLNVEVDVPNQSGRLLPGAYTIVHLKVPSSEGAVTVPSNALLFRAEGLRAAVVRDGHVKLTPIKIGQDYGGTLEIVAGLNASDSVVINPADSLADGAAVKVRVNAGGGAQR